MAPSCKHISNLIVVNNDSHTTYYDMFESYDQEFFNKRNESLNIRVYKKKIDENKLNNFITSFLNGEVMYAQKHFDELFLLKDSLDENEVKYRIRQIIQNEINNHNYEFTQFGELVLNDFLFHKTLTYARLLENKITHYNIEDDALESLTKSYINQKYATYRDCNIMMYIHYEYLVDVREKESVLNREVLIKKLDAKYRDRILALFQNVQIAPKLGQIAKVNKDIKNKLYELKKDDEVLVLHKSAYYNKMRYSVITNNGRALYLMGSLLRTLPSAEQTPDRINQFKFARQNKLKEEQVQGYPIIGKVFHVESKYFAIETVERRYVRIPYSIIPDAGRHFEIGQFVDLFVPKWLYEKYYN